MNKLMSDIQTPNRRIQALQAILWRLQSEKIPDKVQIDIDSALEHLEAIRQVLVSGEEHSRLAALYRVSQVLGTSLDLDEVLNQVMDAVIGLTGAERGFLVLVEEATDELIVQVGRNMEQEALQREEMEYSRTVIRTVLESGTGVVTTNAQEDPRFSEQESVISLALRSILCAPLRARGLVIGAIYVDNRAQAGLFTEADLEMLDAFASQAAAAIENARLYTRTDQSLAERVEELESLARFARELNLHEHEDEVLATTQKWALEGTNADEVWIAMLSKEGNEEKITVAMGPGLGEELSLGHPLLKPVLDGNTPHVFEPTGDAPSSLVVPIMGARTPIGILVAESAAPFPSEDLQFLVRLANQAAVAFGKVRVNEMVDASKVEKAQFVSVVAHELRIPMTSIMGYTDLLKKGSLGEVNEQQLNFLTVIRDNVGRMAKLISDLSDIYKVESGRLHLEPIPLPMRAMVERTLETIPEELLKKNQKMFVFIAEDLPRAQGDPARVEQVLKCLMDNASRYSSENSEIEIRGRIVGDFIQISIKDQGLGISKADQAQLFTQFFRSERSEVREEEGWGLGLSVVKNLVELMRGEVGFESELDQGSTFWFTLPMVGPGRPAPSS
jgi:signal transduction histidine kinase